MKRIAHLVAGAVLAIAAQAAWSEQAPQVGQASGQTVVGMLETLGIAGNGPFPSRGGPIDE